MWINLFFTVIFVIGAINCQEDAIPLDVLISSIFNTSSGPNPGATSKPVIINPTPPHNQDTGSIPSRNDDYTQKSCGVGKECVQHYLCQNNTIVKDGYQIIDIRIDGTDCHYLQKCCAIENQVTKPTIIIPQQNKGCGYRNIDGVGFKITGDGDNEAQYGEFPWMCAILRQEQATDQVLNLYQCGGSIIAPNVVLTAAHCVKARAPNTLKVRAGEWDTQSKIEILPEQDRQVIDMVVHPEYNSGSLYNDVALLFLDSPFEWAENVKPVCLPPSGMSFDYSRCYATGWGKNDFGKNGKYQVILKKIDLPVMPKDQCVKNLRTTRLGSRFELHPSFICAGGEQGKDTCRGDGGSPLACPVPGVPDQFYQAGIVAWGIGCGERDIPGVYASVPYLRSWIDEQLRNKQIDPSHFTA